MDRPIHKLYVYVELVQCVIASLAFSFNTQQFNSFVYTVTRYSLLNTGTMMMMMTMIIIVQNFSIFQRKSNIFENSRIYEVILDLILQLAR